MIIVNSLSDPGSDTLHVFTHSFSTESPHDEAAQLALSGYCCGAACLTGEETEAWHSDSYPHTILPSNKAP